MPRRTVLKAAGLAGASLTLPGFWRQMAVAGAPAPQQVHLQFGDDAARQVAVSWATPAMVGRPRLRFGSASAGFGTEVAAQTRTYVDHATGREIFTHHAVVSGLDPSTAYRYQVLNDGAAPVGGRFETGPAGRAPFRFTSFGDQGVAGQSYGSPYSAEVVGYIEALKPVVHLVNGDLAYADLQQYPGATWDSWFGQIQPSAANRPWMAAAGNHENETGNGPNGYASFLTRFWVPDNGLGELAGYFYAFTVGSVRFVVLQNDDVCYQNAGNFYVRGYSGGRQRKWLEATLAAARSDPAIDWIVVCMHQLVMSSAVAGNGCDLGIREAFAPLFDAYGVDLVLCGHDHDYERTYAVRGVDRASPTLRPRVASTATSVIDTTKGAVHLTLGGGGSIPLNVYGGHQSAAVAKVIVDKGSTLEGDVETEVADWSAVTDPAQAFGFASYDVDPGRPGGKTTITATYYRSSLVPGGPPSVCDRFVLERPRRG
ncbi:MAG TPA: metallophosphoesterase family protein [Acidimicrobiales bacterium]|nr:metallophosphoesterase family protein [Acidimicrobiales bacterium]